MTLLTLNDDPITFDMLKEHFPHEYCVRVILADIANGFDINKAYVSLDVLREQRIAEKERIARPLKERELAFYKENPPVDVSGETEYEITLHTQLDQLTRWNEHVKKTPELTAMATKERMELRAFEIQSNEQKRESERAHGREIWFRRLRTQFQLGRHTPSGVTDCPGCVSLTISR